MASPEVFVLAGPNGAGKTTVAGRLLPNDFAVSNFVNADFIAQGLTPLSPEASALEAGRMMVTRIHQLRDLRASFGFETTLASRTFFCFLHESRDTGYVVHIVYIWLSNPDLAVRRVQLRVQRGGHDIPEATIRRRYSRSLRNFFQLYQPLADTQSVWDNSGECPVMVAQGMAGNQATVVDAERWTRIQKQASSDAR